MDFFQELKDLTLALDAGEVDYALDGGVALAIHGVPRATQDIDLLVRPEDLSRLREVARARGCSRVLSITRGQGDRPQKWRVDAFAWLREMARLLDERGFASKGVDMSRTVVTLRLQGMAALSTMCLRLGKATITSRDDKQGRGTEG